MEYLISWRGWDGNTWTELDPGNPNRVRGVFGDHSLVEFAGYQRPAWLDSPMPQGWLQHFEHWDSPSAVGIGGVVWSPGQLPAEEPMPLLVVHDGPEYADLAQLLRYLGWLAKQEHRLRCRVLLLQPDDRNRIYSASPGYARALTDVALPTTTKTFSTTHLPVGLGASLGGLALVHAAVRSPGTFAGILSQSGSFFQPISDDHEHGFAYYDRVVRFTAELHNNPAALQDTRLVMTCGTGEENLINNRSLVRSMRNARVPVRFITNPDGHNYTGWRDCLDPVLGDLLRACWTCDDTASEPNPSLSTGAYWRGD